MKTKILLSLALLGIMFGCQQKKQTDAPEVLTGVLTDYFDGLKNKDIDKMNAVTTPDFVIFEDGKVWNNDSLINYVNTFPPYTIDYQFDNFNIHIDNSIGFMYYFDHADIVMNDTINMTADWVESATFVKDSAGWKMNFLHSTVRK